jgi:hypothetical protein
MEPIERSSRPGTNSCSISKHIRHKQGELTQGCAVCSHVVVNSILGSRRVGPTSSPETTTSEDATASHTPLTTVCRLNTRVTPSLMPPLVDDARKHTDFVFVHLTLSSRKLTRAPAPPADDAAAEHSGHECGIA